MKTSKMSELILYDIRSILEWSERYRTLYKHVLFNLIENKHARHTEASLKDLEMSERTLQTVNQYATSLNSKRDKIDLETSLNSRINKILKLSEYWIGNVYIIQDRIKSLYKQDILHLSKNINNKLSKDQTFIESGYDNIEVLYEELNWIKQVMIV
eukprot:GHVP01053963.1.p1 GENE.GHVP01053963.1~~GHVP01053963.1.p1  ORF type:complete len:156 (+),score=11.81 GHVP01053963.1:935-1402(+)